VTIKALLIALLTLFGSAAIVIVADQFFFRYGSWSSWQLTVTQADPEDERWWQSNVGALPPRDPLANIVTPATVPGRDGSNKDGAPGIGGDRGHPPLFAYRMNMASSMMRGGVLISPDVHAWHIGVVLPGGMAVERIYLGKPGVAPPHPTFGGWDVHALPAGFLLNVLIVSVPLYLAGASFVRLLKWSIRTVRTRLRTQRGQCPVCAYTILPGQRQCPECGAAISPPARQGNDSESD